MNPSLKLRTMSAIPACLIFLVFVTSGTVLAEQANSTRAQSYTLGAGDIVAVNVWKNEELSRQLTLSPDGTINYPLIGELPAAGRTLLQFQDDLYGRLKQHIRDPQVTVTLIDAKSYRIYVMGEVMRPGVFELRAPVTVVQALAMAGGFTPFASRNKIAIVNSIGDPDTWITFRYDSFVAGQKEGKDLVDKDLVDKDLIDKDLVLRPGDTVLVP